MRLPRLPALAAAVLCAGAATSAGTGVGGATCEYWLAEESNAGGYSKLNLSGTGLQTNRTISVNGDDFGAGKTMPFPNGSLSHVPMGLDDYLSGFSRSFLLSLVRQRLVPRIVGGAATTNVLILDLEYPFPWVHPCEYGTLNDTTLAAVVNATRLRIQVPPLSAPYPLPPPCALTSSALRRPLPPAPCPVPGWLTDPLPRCAGDPRGDAARGRGSLLHRGLRRPHSPAGVPPRRGARAVQRAHPPRPRGLHGCEHHTGVSCISSWIRSFSDSHAGCLGGSQARRRSHRKSPSTPSTRALR